MGHSVSSTAPFGKAGPVPCQVCTLHQSAMQYRQRQILISRDPVQGYRLQAEMFVPLPIEEVFEVFADAGQLERITPPWLNFSILTPRPIEMHEGTLIDYRLRLRYFPIKWRTEICVWEPPFRFVDQQLQGPYRKWYHEHTFEAVEDGTIVADHVHYISPGGSLVNRFFVQPDLEKIFQYRQDKLQEIFAERKSRLLQAS